jgi:hypothetical protein
MAFEFEVLMVGLLLLITPQPSLFRAPSMKISDVPMSI